jgi:hypothetical protein
LKGRLGGRYGKQTPAQVKRKVRRLFAEYNSRAIVDTFSKWYTPNVVNHFPDGRETQGFDLELFKQLVIAFPDIHLTLDGIVVEGNREAHRYTMTGTFKKAFMNTPPTGKKITVPESVVFQTWRRGKIAEIWWITNDLDMLRQMGVLPTPPKVKREGDERT